MGRWMLVMSNNSYILYKIRFYTLYCTQH